MPYLQRSGPTLSVAKGRRPVMEISDLNQEGAEGGTWLAVTK